MFDICVCFLCLNLSILDDFFRDEKIFRLNKASSGLDWEFALPFLDEGCQ